MTILKIYFDFKSPESYLAFHQTQKISLPDSTQIEWKPFLTKNKKILANYLLDNYLQMTQ